MLVERVDNKKATNVNMMQINMTSLYGEKKLCKKYNGDIREVEHVLADNFRRKTERIVKIKSAIC